MRYLWIVALLIPTLAACGSQSESVVPPTATEVAAATEPPAPAVVNPPVQEVFPTALPQREAAPEPEIALQVVAVAEPGSLDAPDNVVPGELYAFEANANTFRRLTVTQGTVADPVWSPDGLRVYYTADETGTTQIYVLTATNTSPVSQLSPFDVGDQRQPTISPDSQRLAFTSARGGADAIYLMNATDGRGIQQITFNPTPDYDPAWSPDNTWIAFTSERDGNPEIYIMDTSGGQVQRLTDHPASDSQPAFSPDGRQIAFVSDRDGSPQIYVMGLPVPTADPNDISESVAVNILNGVPPVTLDPAAPLPDAFLVTSGDTAKAAPSWFENELGGFSIAYADVLENDLERPPVQVYRMGSDGSNIRPLTQPFINMSAPAVRPGTPEIQVTPAPTVILPTSTPIIQPTEVDPLDLTVTPE
jgi:dipeptidyl aminopeptidase/acylaminoacyl peptidase